MNPPSQVKINGYRTVSDCAALSNAISKGPVAVMVDGSNMQFYHGGVFTNCGTSLSYNMALVASYDNMYRLKSSWGPSWGEGGHIRLYQGNSCGVCMQGGYPQIGWGKEE